MSIFFFENCAFYEIIWKKFVKPDRTQMTIWRMRIACWTPSATSIRWGYAVILTFHCNNCCTNAPQSTVYTYIAYLFPTAVSVHLLFVC